MYYYKIYGLNVSSEIEISEAYKIEPDNINIDVKIKKNRLEESNNSEIVKIANRKSTETFLVNSTNVAIMRIGGLATYYITSDEISVDIMDKQDNNRLVKSFILGSAFGFCLSLRGMVAIHGGGISKNGCGIIISGESGAGKSTITNALITKGYDFIADDVCALSIENKNVRINMAYPQQKLCRDAAIKQGLDLSKLIYIDEDRDKFAVKLEKGYLPDGQKLNYFFEMVISEENELLFSKIDGHEKIFAIIRNIYRGDNSRAMWGMSSDFMKECVDIASKTEMYRIIRPKNKNTIDEIMSFIEEKVKGE